MERTGSDKLQDRVHLAAAQGPSVEQLEDALYDILATGLDPTAVPGSLDAVQFFLHEHARSRKSQAELLAFFAQHELPFMAERGRSMPAPISMAAIEESAAISGELFEGMPAPAAQRQVTGRANRSMPIWLGAACAALVLTGVAVRGYRTLTSMQDELSRVRETADAQAQELSRVQADAAKLRGALNENAELMRSVDHKSELLLQTLVSPLDPAKR